LTVVLKSVCLEAIRCSAVTGVFAMKKQVAMLMIGLMIGLLTVILAGCAKVAPSMMKAAGQGAKVVPKPFNNPPVAAPGYKAANHDEWSKLPQEILQHAAEYGLDQAGLRGNDKNKR
jgi:hypothetical protein